MNVLLLHSKIGFPSKPTSTSIQATFSIDSTPTFIWIFRVNGDHLYYNLKKSVQTLSILYLKFKFYLMIFWYVQYVLPLLELRQRQGLPL